MRRDPGEISLLPVEPKHYPLLRVGLAEPHMREWGGEVEEELGFIRDMVEGRDTTRPFLIMRDGTPVGYVQVWFIGHHQNAEWIAGHPWLAELPADTVGVDLSIGDAAQLSRGIGSAALKAFVAELRRQGYTRTIIDPHPANARAVRPYRKPGFRPLPRLEGRTGDALIMQHEQNAYETT